MIRWKKLRIKLEYRFRISFLDRLNDQQFFLPLLISQSLRVCLSKILFFGWTRKERDKTNKTDKSIDDKMEKLRIEFALEIYLFLFPLFSSTQGRRNLLNSSENLERNYTSFPLPFEYRRFDSIFERVTITFSHICTSISKT